MRSAANQEYGDIAPKKNRSTDTTARYQVLPPERWLGYAPRKRQVPYDERRRALNEARDRVRLLRFVADSGHRFPLGMRTW